MAADALIFDLDGTVWDSASWFAQALADGDARLEERYRAELMGTGNIIRIIQRDRLSRASLIRRAQRLSEAPPLFPGMSDAFDALKAMEKPLAVATSLPGTLAQPMLRSAGLQEVFPVVIHAGLCRVSKPNPASINMALRELGQQAGPGVFYVGDRSSDAEAAQRAGISFAWMNHGYERPSRDTRIAPISPEDLIKL